MNIAKRCIDGIEFKIFFIDMEFGQLEVHEIVKYILDAASNRSRPIIMGISDDVSKHNGNSLGVDDVINKAADYDTIFNIAKNII